MKKFIKVLNRCIVTTSRGRVRGPITTPFREDTDFIYIMIVRDKAKVVETLGNGVEIPLTVDNFNKDNSNVVNTKTTKISTPTSPVMTSTPVVNTPQVKKEEPVVQTVNEVTEPTQDSEPTESSNSSETDNNSYSSKNKKKK